ncbi:hypothetical protein HDE_04825 [Halotydeus destructor]|nr:hypothetical protein HDE_04825 [Halotydeus destructor]
MFKHSVFDYLQKEMDYSSTNQPEVQGNVYANNPGQNQPSAEDAKARSGQPGEPTVAHGTDKYAAHHNIGFDQGILDEANTKNVVNMNRKEHGGQSALPGSFSQKDNPALEVGDTSGGPTGFPDLDSKERAKKFQNIAYDADEHRKEAPSGSENNDPDDFPPQPEAQA